MNAFVIDAFEFCRQKARREGELAVTDLPRLADELADRSGAIAWSLQGGIDKFGHPQMTLSVAGTVQLKCQRCLLPFGFAIAAESTLVLAKDDAAADEIEALLDDDGIEVIVGSQSQDVRELICDEALLALPLAPKHAACPENALPGLVDGEKEASPFAVLRNLKQ